MVPIASAFQTGTFSHRIRLRHIIELVLLAGAIVLSTASPLSSSAAPRVNRLASSPVSTSTLGELSIDSGQASYLGDTRRYGYVILQDYMYAHVAAIKRANPRTRVLAYLEAPVTRIKACSGTTPPAYSPHDSFGINYCYARAHYPAWFLTNRSHARLRYADYPQYAVMDIGNPSYQRTWAANAVAAARAGHFDGIYLDDVNTYPGHGIDGKIAKYTDAAYGRAMAAFMAVAGDRLRAAGLQAVGNVAANPWVSAQRASALHIAAHLTAYSREHYSRYGDICGPFSERFNSTATNGTPPIGYMLAFDRAVQATGARLMGVDYGYKRATTQDLKTMAYGRAAFLLAWNGRPGSAYIYRPCGTVNPAVATWTVELGLPTGPATLSNGVYTRRYSAGLVVLNSSRGTRRSVTIGAGYRTSAGTAVASRVTLAPETALLLRHS
jgi:hypothetical protein